MDPVDRDANGPAATGAASPARTDAGTGGVQSVDRAITIMEILTQRGEAGVTEIAAEIEVHKSTAFRLLGALEARDLVEQTEDRGKYRLGFGVVRLASSVSSRMDISRESRPVCQRLAEEIGETVNVAVLRSHYAVNVDQVRGTSLITAYNWVGHLTPLHATSSGKVLLSHLDSRRRAELLRATGLEGFTPNTVTTVEALEHDLRAIREQGYAICVEEYEIGLNAMAAPVRSLGGEVVAAVSASGPAYRFSERRIRELTPVLVEGAAEISHRLGA